MSSGGADKFYSVGGWNSKSSCKSKQDLEDWPGLEHNDLLEPTINQEGAMLVHLKRVSVGTWQSGIAVDSTSRPLLELHAKDVCIKLMSLESSPHNKDSSYGKPYRSSCTDNIELQAKPVCHFSLSPHISLHKRE